MRKAQKENMRATRLMGGLLAKSFLLASKPVSFQSLVSLCYTVIRKTAARIQGEKRALQINTENLL